MRRYIFVFPVGNQIQWSGENQRTILTRNYKPEDNDLVAEFVDSSLAAPGSFIKLSTGEMIFRTA